MNMEFAKQWLGDFNVNLERAMDLYDDDAVVSMVNGQTISKDKAAIQEFFANFCNIDPKNGSWEFIPLAYYGDEHKGVIPFTWTGKSGSDFMGIPVEPGTAVDSVSVSIHEYKNGKIMREETFWDPITMFSQLGVWETVVASAQKG